MRILYLKEVRKHKPQEEQDEPFSDKKSLAYLSSLIQDERKGSIEPTISPTHHPSSGGFLTTPAIVNRRRPQSFHVTASPNNRQFSHPKENSLTEILGSSAFNATEQHFNLKKKIRPELKLKGCLNKELKEQYEKDFVRFCIDVKHSGRSYPYKCLLPTSKTVSELSYN